MAENRTNDNRKPVRIFGRVDDETWANLKKAAEKSGKSFTQWALDILLKAAKQSK